MMLKKTGDSQFAMLQASVENTFKERHDDAQPISSEQMDAVFSGEAPIKVEERSWDPRDPLFAQGRWCFDTPGTVNDEQLLNQLTLEELIAVLPRRLLRPRSLIVHRKYSLLIAGLARIDVEECHSPVLLTVFASDRLPLNWMPTGRVEKFLQHHGNNGDLVAPVNVERRPQPIPELRAVELTINGIGDNEGAADVVLSSVGWVMVTGNGHIRLSAFTPAGKGVHLRQPAMLPFSVLRKGARIRGTAFYRQKPVQFPVNQTMKRKYTRKG